MLLAEGSRDILQGKPCGIAHGIGFSGIVTAAAATKSPQILHTMPGNKGNFLGCYYCLWLNSLVVES